MTKLLGKAGKARQAEHTIDHITYSEYFARNPINGISQNIYFARQHTVRAMISRIPGNVAGAQIGDNGRVKHLISVVGNLATCFQHLSRVRQIFGFSLKIRPFRFDPIYKTRKDFHTTLETPTQNSVQRMLFYVGQKRFRLPKPFINAVFQISKIDRDKTVRADQITVIIQRHLREMIAVDVISRP